MTFKQWTAVIQLAGAVLVGGWLIKSAAAADWTGTIEEAAQKMLWALLFIIVFNIIASIVLAILVSIAQGKEMKDERADERDKAVNARSMRNAYLVASTGGAATLLLLGLGGNPQAGIYVLFGTLLLAGATDAASRLVYYRLG